MEGILCSRAFKHFFDLLHRDFSSLDELVKTARVEIAEFADDIALGKMTANLVSPATIYQANAISKGDILYEAAEYEKDVVEKLEIRTPDGGSLNINAYPLKGHVWTEMEQEEIRFLAQNIYVLFGRIRMQGLIRQAYMTDNLTGALNSSGLGYRGNVMGDKGTLSKFNCFFINIKNFRYVNGRVGNKNGDLVLKEFVRQVSSVLSEQEIFARLGGDNFVALIVKENTEAFIKFIKKRDVLLRVNEKEISFELGARVGIYDIQEGDNIDKAMNASSVALQFAKNTRDSDCRWFEKAMMERELRRKEISIEFPIALRDREFVVYYQPKVSLESNDLCGCEALVRWIKNGSMVPPMNFIPILEEDDSICKLDMYVLDVVCKDIRKWLEAGIEPVKVSVNFSKIHFRSQSFAEDIIEILRNNNVDGKYIEVELTETFGNENYETMTRFIEKMKAHGVAVSIDDFGTGYSSLNLLKDLRVDIIKLDKTFIDNIEKHSKIDEIVIRNIINMINELDMEVLAEGVETAGQAEFLKNANCKMVQGYLFDKPLPHDDFEKRLTEGRHYMIKK